MATPTILSAEAILAANDLPTDTVEVPEWGGSVRVRGFSKAEQLQMRQEAKIDDEVDSDRLEMLMFVHGVTEPVFTAADAQALLGKSASAIDRVLGVILKLSGGAPGQVTEMEKTFPAEPGDEV